MKCFNKEVIEMLEKTYPQEKIKVWFSVESKMHKERWYTDITLQYIEVPRLVSLEKMKGEVSFGDGMDFGSLNTEF